MSSREYLLSILRKRIIVAMKLLAILLTILIFGPIIRDDAVLAHGRKGRPATSSLPLELSLNLAFHSPRAHSSISDDNLRSTKHPQRGKEVLQVPPTSIVWLDHNNAALSGPTISIPTEHQVIAHLAAAKIGDPVTKLHPHANQELWSNVRRWWRINLTWAIKCTSLVYLFVVVAVGSGLLEKHAIYHRNLRSEPVALSAPDSKGTLVHRASSQLVISKQPNRPVPWITIYLAEGVLSMHPCFTISNSGGPVQWSILFQRQQHRFLGDLITRVAIDGRLFNVPLRGILNYQPWAPHITRGFNVPWEVVEKSGEVNATSILHGAAPTRATTSRAIANCGSEASAALALIEGANDACRVTQVPAVNSPPPSRPTSPGFTSEYEAPITEAADPLPPSNRFDLSHPDAIHSFNRALSTNQYIARLYLTQPAQPLPNRTVPADQAAMVRSYWRPVLRGLADRAEERHPSQPLAAESEEGHVMAEGAGPSVVEDQPEISSLEEGSSGTDNRGPKPHRGGKRTARMKRLAARAREAGLSTSNEGPDLSQLADFPPPLTLHHRRSSIP